MDRLLADAARAEALAAIVSRADRSHDDRAALLDAIAAAVRQVTRGALPGVTSELALSALARAAHALAGFGVHLMGRPAFLSAELLDLLRDEAQSQHLSDESDPGAVRRTTRPAGEALAHVAVSRQLREAVSAAAGRPLTATFDALYEYDPPGSHVRTHLDARGYDWTCHLVVEHRDGHDDAASVLVAHRPDGTREEHILRVGEAVVLRGRGTLHSWEPLGPDEHRILTAIGFRDPDRRGA